MKRIPLLSIVLTLSIATGFLLLYPVEIVVLGSLLIVLVTAQIVVVRRHLHPVERHRGLTGAGTGSGPGLGDTNTPRSESFAQAAGARQQPPGQTADSVEAPAPELPVSGDVFSRFRAQLEAAESGNPAEPIRPGAALAEAPAPPVPAEEPEDRVAISAQARKKSPPAKAQAKPLPLPAEPDGADLFEGLVPKPPKTQPSLRREKEKQVVGKQAEKPAPPPTAERKKPEPKATPKPPAEEESGMLLKLVEDALNAGDSSGAAAGMEQLLANQGGGRDASWRVRLAQARLAVMGGDISGAVSGFEKFLGASEKLEEGDILGQIGRMAEPLPEPDGDRLRVSLMLKLLNVHRQANDRPAMDRLYSHIQEAQEKTGDEEKLLQYYKNHLEIKKVLGDVEGQLELIDRIGNRYYKKGDTKTAKDFYERGLKLREEQTATDSMAEKGKTGPPP